MKESTAMALRLAKRLVTEQELADLTKLSRDTIKRRRADGTITAYKVGPRAIRYDPDEAIAALVKPAKQHEETQRTTAPKDTHKTTTEPELISVQRAGELVDLSALSIRRMIASGYLREYRIPGLCSIRIDRRELLAVCRGEKIDAPEPKEWK